MVLKLKVYRIVKQPRLHLTEHFPDLIAQAGLSQRAFARRAGLSFSTIMGLVHPELHPGRRGGMQRRTAWLIAKAYGELTNTDLHAAFRLLIVEHADAASERLSTSDLTEPGDR